MNRNRMIDFLKFSPDIFDIIIIGGGATGLGAAVDATSRGYRTLLLESHDFAKGTSSRSSKLIHGGLRYLRQGNIKLVKEALFERGLLYKNAPHLVKKLPFLIPTRSWMENKYYQLGLKFYDSLAKDSNFEQSKTLTKEEVLKALPFLSESDIYGGIRYLDGQFDDARLAITLAKTSVWMNGVVVNYCPVTGLLKKNGKINGVIAHDVINKEEYRLHAKAVINATGVFSDDICKMDDTNSPKIVRPSQGIHLVFKNILKGKQAVIIPKTTDKRVLFLIPWYNHTLVGTTDTEVDRVMYEPEHLESEVDFLLENTSKYLKKALTKDDILSVFSGLRPLVSKKEKSTAELSRDHMIKLSKSGLLTIIGGKWTTYRKMAEDAIDKAVEVAGLKFYPSDTKNLKLQGYLQAVDYEDQLSIYGTEKEKITQIINENPEFGKTIHPDLSYLAAEVIWACRDEMAETLEDVLARRTRSLFLNAKATVEASEKVVDLMKDEKAKDESWKENQIQAIKNLSKKYLIQKI